MSGWISLHRSSTEHWVYADAAYWKMWTTMLIKANHKERNILFNGSLVRLKRGEFVFGRTKFSQETKTPVSKVRRLLELLKSDQMISQQKFNKYSIISILNYDQYQNINQQTDQQTASKPPANRQQTATDNNVNNVNNVNKGRFTPPKLKDVLEYTKSRPVEIDAEKFLNFYESKGWMVGKNKMKDWKASVRTWEKSSTPSEPQEFERQGI